MTDFPQHVKFCSDHTEVEYVSTLKGTKEPMAEYRYVKADARGNLVETTVTLALVQLQRLFEGKLIEIK